MRDDDRPSFRPERAQIVIPARRFRGQVLGLGVCLIAWPLVASLKLAGLFLVGGWRGATLLLGLALLFILVFAILQIAWWLAGSERIAVLGRDLRVRHTILGATVASRSYRGADIQFLAPTAYMPSSSWSTPSLPFLGGRSRGALKFRYRGKTVYFAHDLRPADAGLVADWLAARLPSGAVEAVT